MYTQVPPSVESFELCDPSVGWMWSALFYKNTHHFVCHTAVSQSVDDQQALQWSIFLYRQTADAAPLLTVQAENARLPSYLAESAVCVLCCVHCHWTLSHISSVTNMNVYVTSWSTCRLKGVVFLKFSQLLPRARQHLLSKNIRHKTYRTIILPVVIRVWNLVSHTKGRTGPCHGSDG
jgi:hypothetical protein